ncbi:ABC transporter substrate-binding protein [Martelella limonii]|uniref:ABC transporter substrate-binding protein n=1 Tax=Martelella limonii TaxID=1647649 RepID=UPI001580B67E|nr:ABC transporter substrate-binding protein [Martelella limonii]
MITIALEKIDFLPPDRVTDDASILTLKNLVLEPMLRWENGAARPGLFDRWHLSDDGCRWTLTLRDGAAYHDGAPVTADDARRFIVAICDARDMFGMPWSYARYLEGAEITAEGAVLSIATPDAFPDLPDILSEFYLPKIAPDGTATIGTGPWQVVAFERGASVTVRHSDGRELRLIAMPEAEARLQALSAGEIDVATHLERLDTPRRSLDGHVWHEQPTTLSVIAYMNGREGAFADPSLRLAANLALDREKLVSEVMGGLGVPAKTIVSPFHNGMADQMPDIPFDPERAAALVAASAAPKTLTLRTPLYMPERAPEIAAFIAKSLQAVGFAVTIDTAHDRPGYARELGAKKTGDLAIFDSSPHSTFRVLDDKISSRSRAVWWQGVEDQEADQLFETARRTVATEARAKAYARVLAHLGAHPHWLYLFHPIDCMAHAAGLDGFSLDPKGYLRVA